MDSLSLSLAAVLLACAAIAYGVFQTYASRRRLVTRVEAGESESASPVAASLKQRILQGLSLLGKWGLENEQETRKINILLIHGGFRHPFAPAIFYGLKALTGLVLLFPLLLYLVINDRLGFTSLLICLALSGAGYFLPQLLLIRAVNKRQRKIEKIMVDVMDLLTICMEAGMSVQAALKQVAKEIRPLSKEFYAELQLVGAEMRAGIQLTSALRHLSQRTGVASVQSLTTMIIQSEKMGARIAESLRVHAEYERKRLTLKAEEKASMMPVKILIPLVFFIFPAMFIVVMGPGVLKVLKGFGL